MNIWLQKDGTTNGMAQAQRNKACDVFHKVLKTFWNGLSFVYCKFIWLANSNIWLHTKKRSKAMEMGKWRAVGRWGMGGWGENLFGDESQQGILKSSQGQSKQT